MCVHQNNQTCHGFYPIYENQRVSKNWKYKETHDGCKSQQRLESHKLSSSIGSFPAAHLYMKEMWMVDRKSKINTPNTCSINTIKKTRRVKNMRSWSNGSMDHLFIVGIGYMWGNTNYIIIIKCCFMWR